MRTDVQTQIDRCEIEHKEEWREWIEKIPAIPMRDGWSMKPVPPFAGAIARFYIIEGDKKRVSVYLDVFERLACTEDGRGYWEVYGSGEDPDRCDIDDVDELIRLIEKQLTQSTPHGP